jgi:transposase, IS30 family
MALPQQNTTSIRSFKHLSTYDRGRIHALAQEGLKPADIARKLDRHRSTICREIERGTTRQLNSNLTSYESYFAETGQAVYEKNRSACGRKSKALQADEFLQYVEEKILREKWSPDAAVGEARLTKAFSPDAMVCTKTLYAYINQGILKVRNIDLLLKTRRKIKRSFGRKHKRLFGNSISERPKKVDERQEYGHWEIDTVIGKLSADHALLTLTERKTRQHFIFRLEAKCSKAVDQAMDRIKETYGERFRDIFKSITADNGSEFATLMNHGIDVYYAHPYSAWERGCNERHNGLIRRFIPKGKAIRELTHSQLERIQQWCNNLPRKILGYRRPAEVFQQELEQLMQTA